MQNSLQWHLFQEKLLSSREVLYIKSKKYTQQVF